MAVLKTIDPATGKAGRQYETFGPETLEAALDAVVEAQAQWRETDFALRAQRIRDLGGLLDQEARRLAESAVAEMGKPLQQAIAELRKCVTACTYTAEQGAALLASRPVDTPGAQSFVCFRPLGVVLAIMPWNFPFWQVIRCAIPALMAGNAVVLKHASNVTGCALELEALFERAGFPRNLFRTLLLDHAQVEQLIRDRRIHAVSLTGSVEAGRRVAQAAGGALKKCVLELGGSDAYVVLADADVAAAARVCVAARLVNGGQSCIAAKRFIVVESLRAAFTQAVIDELRGYTVGEPLAEGTRVGPMARTDLRDELHAQVRRSMDLGARCLLGGELPEGPGAYYPVTLLDEVRPGMPAYDEELFGPVAAILPARDDADALRIANDSEFGLGGAVFTRDHALGLRLAEQSIEAGSVFVNRAFASSAELPFGGIRHSGYGRELGAFGILEFVNIKAVSIAEPAHG